MNFRIDKGRFSVAESGESLKIRSGTSESERIKELLARRPSTQSSEPEPLEAEDLSQGQTQVISNIQRKIDVADEGLEAMIRIREQQVYLAREGASLPYQTRRHETLSSEATSAIDELKRIHRGANGSGAFPELANTNTYGATELSTDTNQSVSTGAIPVQVAAVYVRLSSADSSATVKTLSEDTLQGLRSFDAGFDAAARKADRLIPKPVEEALPVNEATKDTLSSVEEAKDLASSIANRIGNAGADDESAAKLIEASTSNFDLDRIRDLLG